jgi:cysteine synthase A
MRVFDDIAASMIWAAKKMEALKPAVQITQPTTGNTAIALAFVCPAKGYKWTLTMPETMSRERRAMLQSFGAQLILTSAAGGMGVTIQHAAEWAARRGWFSSLVLVSGSLVPCVADATWLGC